KIELLGAPAGVELRVGNKLLGRTDGSADFPFPETVVPGRETLLVSEGGASWPYPHEFQPEETLKLPWKDVAASRPQNVKPPINQPANPPAAEEDDPSVPLYATLTWRSRLEDGETVVINGRVLIPNHLAGIQLPGLPVTVSATTPGVTVIQQPSPGDQWSTFAIRNDSKRPLDMIRLRWQRIRQK
ncbi:MAG: hypothetical protein LAQ69_42165, partial [Acidobacteriia bacterium]|nr:hypothetical protein [Terriglobia bacterium]